MELRVNNLSCGYGNRVVVDGITFTAHSGEIICILGPNGVGKTTFFKTLLGFLPKKGGEMVLDGNDMSHMSVSQMAKNVAYVPQTQSPAFPYKVREVIAMGCTPSLKPFSTPSHKDYMFCYSILKSLDVPYLFNKTFNEISGGERQMVLIARALAQRPKLLLMDEPTSNLDYGNQMRMLKCIYHLSKSGIGIVMTTHFPDHAFLCPSKVALFGKREGFVFGSAEEIITEEALEEIYRIKVNLTDIDRGDGKKVRSCTPILDLDE